MTSNDSKNLIKFEISRIFSAKLQVLLFLKFLSKILASLLFTKNKKPVI